MTVLTVAAALQLATSAACGIPRPAAELIVGFAISESGLNTEARHQNPNGTWDYGLAQINSSNLHWLGLTPETVMEPCANLTAGVKVVFAKYNGNPPDEVKAIYAQRVMTNVGIVAGTPPSPPPPEADDPNDPRPPDWDLVGNAEWRDRQARKPHHKAATEPPVEDPGDAEQPVMAVATKEKR
jgi:hypothetical protein